MTAACSSASLPADAAQRARGVACRNHRGGRRVKPRKRGSFACLFTIGHGPWDGPCPAAPLARRRWVGGGRTASFAGRRGP